jgi:hypothetical protein
MCGEPPFSAAQAQAANSPSQLLGGFPVHIDQKQQSIREMASVFERLHVQTLESKSQCSFDVSNSHDVGRYLTPMTQLLAQIRKAKGPSMRQLTAELEKPVQGITTKDNRGVFDSSLSWQLEKEARLARERVEQARKLRERDDAVMLARKVVALPSTQVSELCDELSQSKTSSCFEGESIVFARARKHKAPSTIEIESFLQRTL